MPSPPAAPRVGIVIVNYRGCEDTLECLESLRALTYPHVEIVLVDNASGDGTPDAVRRSFPEVCVLENPVNSGFAGGNNAGIRIARSRQCDYLFLLNNDTVVDPGLLEPLVGLAESDPSIGVLGPTMLYHSEPEIVWSAGGMVDGQGRVRMIGQGEPERRDTGPVDVDYVVGCGLMISGDVLDRIGLLDESYFLYFEETDLCARARKAGYRIVSHPAARIWHKVSRSTGADSELTLYYMRRNALFYLYRHGTRAGLARAITDSLRLAFVWSLQGKLRRRQILLRAIADFMRGRGGKADLVSG